MFTKLIINYCKYNSLFQYDHYFETTHKKSYCRQNYKKVPKALKHLEGMYYINAVPESMPVLLTNKYYLNIRPSMGA